MPNAKMQAIFKMKREPGIEVLETDVPKIGDTDILIKVASGSDRDAVCEFDRPQCRGG